MSPSSSSTARASESGGPPRRRRTLADDLAQEASEEVLHPVPRPDVSDPAAAWDLNGAPERDDVYRILPPPPSGGGRGFAPRRTRAPTPTSLRARMISERDDGALSAEGGNQRRRQAAGMSSTSAQAAATVPPPPAVRADAAGAQAATATVTRAERSAGNRKKLREALIDHALKGLPEAPDATIMAASGVKYDPYNLDLFLCHRAYPPWEAAWKDRPLVLHDRRLADVILTHLSREDQPRDHVEALTKILGHHPGPVSSFRLDSSLCPGADMLASWVDTLSDKGVEELIVFNLYHDVATSPFPLRRLRDVTTLALGFLDLDAQLRRSDGGWCCGRSLTTLSLTECRFRVADLSGTIQKLGGLTSLTLGWCNLLGYYPGTTTFDPTQGLDIESTSLLQLSLWKCTASALIIQSAPKLKFLEIGISAHVPGAAGTGSSNAQQAVYILLLEAGELQELQSVNLPLHVFGIHGPLGPHQFKRKKRESLLHLTTLGLAVDMRVSGQASALMDLLSQFPLLSDLTISRADFLLPGGDDDKILANSWRLTYIPVCIKESLTNLIIKDYQGGAAEHALITSILKAARSLLLVTLHLHPTLWVSMLVPQKATAPFKHSPRASKMCAITIAEEPTALSPLDNVLHELNLI